MGTQELHTFEIIRNGFCTDKFVPQYFVTKRILNDHEAKIAPPIGCIHINDHFFMTGNHMDMTHRFEPTPNSTFVNIIFRSKLI